MTRWRRNFAGTPGLSATMAGLIRTDAVRKRARRPKRSSKVLPAPSHFRATAVSATSVSLAWDKVPGHGRRIDYEVSRGGRRVGLGRARHFRDTVKPRRTYRYTVRAKVGRTYGRRSRTLVVHTPAAPKPVPAPVPPTLTVPMVDRLFWRAGFGPSTADRAQWVGKRLSELVEHFLTAPYSLAPTSTPPSYLGNPIDPLASDPELQMEWLDRMQRATNPFVERVNFFWHRHFAVSRDDGIPSQALLAYRDRLRRYSDFASNPSASFRDLALEMTTQDAAMSQYLTGYLNRKGRPNENYAREFMELFTLGVTDAKGNPNYSQSDVTQLARAFTGYNLDQSAGTVSFNPAQYDGGVKTVLGQTGTFDAPAAVNIVLSHPSHAAFLVAKLWSEFIAAPIPSGTLTAFASAYRSSGLQLVPLLRSILNHPLIFDSLSEPAMTKPPVVYTVGVLRVLGAPLKDNWQTRALHDMQQQPYHPPNVAGWEGGLSWMTTGTSNARFDLIVRCQGLLPAVVDVPTETPDAAFARAYSTCGEPWISPATLDLLRNFARQAPTATAAQRRQRQYALCAFILGGPDGQVM